MKKNIGKIVAELLVIQTLAIFIIYKYFNTDTDAFTFFLIYTVLWHGLLLLFLLLYKGEFVNIYTNAPVDTINTANKITLCRISSVPLVVFLLKNHRISGIKIVLVIVLVFVFLTDLFDGIIARKCRQETGIGRMLDSMSDYSLLALVSIVYFQLGILPAWFFVLILGRLLFQTVGMTFFMLLKFPAEVKSTKGGKITVFITMSLYTFKLLYFFIPHLNGFNNVFKWSDYICGVVIFIFLFEKIHIFYNHYIEYKKIKNNL